MRRWRAGRTAKILIAAGMALAVAVPSFLLTRTADAATAAPHTMPVDAADCTETALTGFGEAPADDLREGSCRRFTVTTYTAYLARASDADNRTLPSAVYSFGGSLACAVVWCDLGAGIYYLVADPGEPEPRTEPFRATVVNLLGPGCDATSAQGFSTAYRGTFSHQGEVQCLDMPEPSGRYQVTLPPGDPNRPMVQLIQNQNARMCTTATTAITDLTGCEVRIPQPTRLIVVVQDPRSTGDYQVAVQRTTGETGCAELPPGRPGAPGHATVPLSGGEFVTCFSLAPGGSGSQEVLTLDRVVGDGTASLSVYNYDGALVCRDDNAAAYQQIGCRLGDDRHMVVVRSATGSGQYRVSQVTGISAACATPASTAFGGPATAGSISVSGDVRCYRTPESSWIGATGDQPTVRYFDDDGALRTCSALPCRVPAAEVLATSAEPAEYRLDTWAVGPLFATPADCGIITDTTAYGFGPVTATLNAADRAHCVSVPVGSEDTFRLTVQNAEPYVINPDFSITRCAPSDATWLCSPKPQRVSNRALVAFVAGREGPLRAEAECVTLLCDEVHFGLGTSGDGSPLYTLTAGTTATLTIHGVALHQRDTVALTRYDKNVKPIVVRTVAPDRGSYTADIDLTGVEPGTYDIAVTSYAEPNRPLTYRSLVRVQPTSIAVSTKPSITGKAAVGLKVSVKTGVWSPAVTSYQYQWFANGVAIARTTGSSYPIPAAMRGKRLTVRVTGNRTGYKTTAATTAAVTVAYGAAPKATAKPKIVGTVKVAKTVKASVGAWTPKAASYRYEWRVNGKLVSTAASLKLAKAWAAKTLTLTVVAKRTGHSDGRAVSAGTKIKK
ncbi:hypothetical protein M1L60_01715 [Actinoplanes sp. TRM 88003]|uniref:Uncharacterized protein n=1 Tax=Paractinoplanes aksuensis TaxID=2939490 RepID=A0ABT1DER1_9ACTN|nr:hypothetical protein [Actinoplanes aksuensis]MCO8269303.1 hypothetical protein [Actinoplanes aksuensis]